MGGFALWNSQSWESRGEYSAAHQTGAANVVVPLNILGLDLTIRSCLSPAMYRLVNCNRKTTHAVGKSGFRGSGADTFMGNGKTVRPT
jgi:hypothetical protein